MIFDQMGSFGGSPGPLCGICGNVNGLGGVGGGFPPGCDGYSGL